MRQSIVLTVLLIAVVAFSGVAAAETTVLRVGASTLPHAPILEFVKPMLAEEGIELQIIEFSDYVLPNLALGNGEIDANFFQHVPYMEDFAANHRLSLTWTEKVFIAPIGLYSRKVDSIDELPRGARIAIPNDVTNGGRALVLLAEAGLLELREGVGSAATVFDIVSNPMNFRFLELEAPLLPRALDEVDAAFINQTYALEANLKPTEDAILLEGAESPYANVVAARTDNADDPAIQKLGEVLTRPEVREFILEYFDGSLVPTF